MHWLTCERCKKCGEEHADTAAQYKSEGETTNGKTATAEEIHPQHTSSEKFEMQIPQRSPTASAGMPDTSDYGSSPEPASLGPQFGADTIDRERL